MGEGHIRLLTDGDGALTEEEVCGIEDDRLAAPTTVIAPTFANFTFRGWSVDDDNDNEDKEAEKKAEDDKKMDEHAFDVDAAPIVDDFGDDGGGGGPDDNFA